MADLEYWLWLTSRKGLGAVGAMEVLDCFGTPERAYYGEREDYQQLNLPDYAKRSLLDKNMDQPNHILGDCDRLGLRIMTFQDADYPQRLREISSPPVVLYIRGKTFRFDEEAAIGVVGMRSCTAAGMKRAYEFSRDLAAQGALVVSGIAEGIDSSAVVGALHGGGRVVSMLAGGVDRVFPYESRRLYEDVAAAGALISEYPPGTPHRGEHFKPRNRILSGLCLGVLAVECNTKGGTMLTVNHAMEQGRDLFAVPIGLDERAARGTNRLISNNQARLVESAADILADYADRYPRLAPGPRRRPEGKRVPRAPEPDRPGDAPPAAPVEEPVPRRETVPLDQQKSHFTDDELAILSATAQDALSADEIVEKTGIPAKRILSALTMLQVEGAVEERPGRRFCALMELEQERTG